MQTFSAAQVAAGWQRTACLFLLAGLVSVLPHAAIAQDNAPTSSADPVYRVTGPRGETQIVEKFSKIVETPTNIVRVDGFDPAVIDVKSITAAKFRVQALAQGVTTVVFTDNVGISYVVDVFVAGDVRHLQAYITRLFPGSAVKAVAVRDSVVLRGWVSRPENINAIVEIAEQFYGKVLNQMVVGGAQQVMLKVRVMEVQRSKIRQLGFNFLYLTQEGVLSSTPGSLVQLQDLSTPFGGPQGAQLLSGTLSAPQIAAGVVSDNSIFQGFLEALKQERLLKILAEPTLNTANGRPAQMLAGGEFPILVPQSLGTTTIEYREFGVRLEAVPTILGDGRVRLELQPEVSERDFTNSVSVNGFTVPGLTTRRVNTQVEMKFGQTYMLAGLLSLRRTASTSKVPWLGELPWIGAAFRRVQYEEGETELVIMVTPERAGALSPSQVPPGGPGMFTDVPTDRELYQDGMIEVPSYGDRCSSGCQTGDCYPGTRMHYAHAVDPTAPQGMNTYQSPTGLTGPAPGPATYQPEMPPPTPAPMPRYDGGGTLFNEVPGYNPGPTVNPEPQVLPYGSETAPPPSLGPVPGVEPNSNIGTTSSFRSTPADRRSMPMPTGETQPGWSARPTRAASSQGWAPTQNRQAAEAGNGVQPAGFYPTPYNNGSGLIAPQ